MAQKPSMLDDKRRFYLLILCIGLVVLLLGLIIHDIFNGNPHSTAPGSSNELNRKTTSTSAVQTGSLVSPLLFGTNMSLFDSNDQVLKSAAIRTQLQQMHIRIIRMPVRSSLSEATEIQAAQAIKSIGAVPLVILRGAVDAHVLADDTRIIQDMNHIFGNNIVYYEYGNEEDLLGVNVSRYTASWNAFIPQLQRIALRGNFVGPVNYHYDRTYLTQFLQAANPRPDEVSWHEYTCADSWASDICISHIARWTTHISDARAAMHAATGSELPIMITEWNYAPDAKANDGKNNNSNFMSTWTTTAIQTLAANRIYASMQYSCTDSAITLITGSNTPTTQGMVLQNQYQQMIVSGQQPPPTTAPGQPQPDPTVGAIGPGPTVALNQYQSFSFEDGGTDGWSGHGSQVADVQNSMMFARDGKHALQVTFTNMGTGDYPYISVGSANLSSYPRAGQTLTAFIYLPSNSTNIAAKLFVMDSNYHWLSASTMTSLTPGTWSQLTYTLPSDVSGQPRLLGIQFGTSSGASVNGQVYVDAVSWT